MALPPNSQAHPPAVFVGWTFPTERFIGHSDVEKHDERNPAVMAPSVSVGTSGIGSDEWV